jgi:hypothetical protein
MVGGIDVGSALVVVLWFATMIVMPIVVGIIGGRRRALRLRRLADSQPGGRPFTLWDALCLAMSRLRAVVNRRRAHESNWSSRP